MEEINERNGEDYGKEKETKVQKIRCICSNLILIHIYNLYIIYNTQCQMWRSNLHSLTSKKTEEL